MKSDETTKAICRIVAEQFKEKFGREINSEIVHNVVQSQFFLTESAFQSQEIVKLDYIGKLAPVEKRIERNIRIFGSIKDNSLPLSRVIFKAKDNGCNNDTTESLRQVSDSEQDSRKDGDNSLRDEW